MLTFFHHFPNVFYSMLNVISKMNQKKMKWESICQILYLASFLIRTIRILLASYFIWSPNIEMMHVDIIRNFMAVNITFYYFLIILKYCGYKVLHNKVVSDLQCLNINSKTPMRPLHHCPLVSHLPSSLSP